MKILDTSFLVSAFLAEDENHGRAMALLEKHRNEDMLLTDLILFETMSVLNRRKGMAFARTAHEKLAANARLQIVYLTESQRKEILGAFLSQQGRLSVADFSVLHACKAALCGALAFDKELLGQMQ